jgi:hypothetical protein
MEMDPNPMRFLTWNDIEPNAARWRKEALQVRALPGQVENDYLNTMQYLATIWPHISNRQTSDDTWGDEVCCFCPVTSTTNLGI